MNLSDAVNRVIELSDKVHDYYETELRKRYPSYPLVDLDEGNVPPPHEEQELRDFLSSLSDELIYQLTLIRDLHRGVVGRDDLAEAYETSKEMIGDRENAISELMYSVTALADELSHALEEFREYKINVDKLPLKKVKTRKR
jgi:hypothetical protein